MREVERNQDLIDRILRSGAVSRLNECRVCLNVTTRIGI
jgi:hypothetical protein